MFSLPSPCHAEDADARQKTIARQETHIRFRHIENTKSTSVSNDTHTINSDFLDCVETLSVGPLTLRQVFYPIHSSNSSSNALIFQAIKNPKQGLGRFKRLRCTRTIYSS